MSYSFAKGAWEVRWRDMTGRQRSKRFADEQAARAFHEAVGSLVTEERDHGRRGRAGGVYPYPTRAGARWRYVYRRSDGSMTSKRGFTSESAARLARRRAVERVARGEDIHTQETFGSFWERWLARRKPYLETGTFAAYERDGRLRLLPGLAAVPLRHLDVERLRDLMDGWVEAVEAEELAAKTINNTLATLVACLNGAVEDGLIASNPAVRVPRLPAAHIERDYLRLHEIPRYFDTCSALYRPLAEVLLRAGLRISEAIALKIRDLELEQAGGVIVVHRSAKRGTVGSTKSDRFRAVEVGPELAGVLRAQVRRRTEEDGQAHDALLFVMRTAGRGALSPTRSARRGGGPIDRITVSRDWHKAALRDAGLRDMPLHALRHSAAATWLAAGNSLTYVQRQLGHADVGTTERYYGHLERHVLAAGAIATEKAIARAATGRPQERDLRQLTLPVDGARRPGSHPARAS